MWTIGSWLMSPTHKEKEKMNHEPDLFNETYAVKPNL